MIRSLLAASTLATGAAYAADTPSPIDDLQQGRMVTVHGTVERITDEDELRLADDSGTVRVYVGPDWVPADVSEAVITEGRVDDDLGPLELYARSMTRADGTVVQFERRYE
ncbi:MAG: hypothetical protein AAF416_20535 [Pseudomonadota bacterium]